MDSLLRTSWPRCSIQTQYSAATTGTTPWATDAMPAGTAGQTRHRAPAPAASQGTSRLRNAPEYSTSAPAATGSRGGATGCGGSHGLDLAQVPDE